MSRTAEKSAYHLSASTTRPAVSSELRRRITHIGMGVFALAVTSFWQSLLMSVSGLALAWVLPKRDPSLLRPHEQAQGYSLGILLYPASVVMLTLLFHNHLWIVGGGWAMMAYGDGMAVVCGQNIPGPRLPWNAKKTVWGTLGFILFGALGAFLTIAFLGNHPFSPGQLALAALAAAVVAAVLESLPYDISDNPLVALAAAATFFTAAQVSSDAWLAMAPVVAARLGVGAAFAAALCLAARATKSVDWSGAVTGGVIALALFLAFSWAGAAQLMAFFVFGTVASKVGYAIKRKKGTAQEVRTWRNAVANAGCAAVFTGLAFVTPSPTLCAAAVAACFAAAASDTVAGEIGRVYGKNPVSIATLRPARTGENGAVSLVGLLAGLVMAFVMSGVGYATGLLDFKAFIVVGVAGMFGNLVDSYLGATVEQRGMIDNEAVNTLCTLSGALLALFLLTV
jgi:uncharacterized protein (TIGR00297 family)